jgi:hypothetical protein
MHPLGEVAIGLTLDHDRTNGEDFHAAELFSSAIPLPPGEPKRRRPAFDGGEARFIMRSKTIAAGVGVALIASGFAAPAHSAPAACNGVTAERASRLNANYRGNGTLRPGDGRVTIQTPCGVCSAGSGFARPSDSRVDGAATGAPVARQCSWASQ